MNAASISLPIQKSVEHEEPGTSAIHRPFFTSAIGVVLTLGALWGAILLLRIAISGSFTSAGLHEVNAHGHAQIFGWVGLFVMGFAYQMLPRLKATALAFPRIAAATLTLMMTGIVLRSVLEPFVDAWPAAALPAVLGNVLEIIAIGAFVWIIAATLRSSAARMETADYFLLAAGGWFFVQAVYDAIYFWATARADGTRLLELISLWQAPLRDIQIHGLAMLVIFGMGQRLLPLFFGFRRITERRSKLVLWLVNLAVVGEVVGFVLMRTAGYRWASLWLLAAIGLLVSAVLMVRGLGVFKKLEAQHRSTKFIRAAHLWLLLSLAMLVLLPVWQFGVLPFAAPGSHAVEIGFSHAYYGAIRHAITVGFISLMIVGMAARAVPEWHGHQGSLPALWIPFILINTGCALRVGMQTLTDVSALAFPITGVSGILEVTGLGFWGFHLLRVMRGR